MPTKIFVVEDDQNIRELTVYALKSADFDVAGFEDGSELYMALEIETPNLILLDVMLPHEDGLQILAKLKSKTNTSGIPVIMLTAKGSELDRVKGLDLGADDYITKPFSPLELLSRIKAVLRRSTPKPEPTQLTYENILLDISKHAVFEGTAEIRLTQKEFALLKFLLENKGVVFSRDKIMDAVWGYDYAGESRTVDMHIKTLRQKLKRSEDIIKTIRGVGYKIG
ncbi:MAG: response regulator transcription factor [Oscillospiraceae bacterium]|nr:response regulator transcription factor [Oscillospiraceae bacterium]